MKKIKITLISGSYYPYRVSGTSIIATKLIEKLTKKKNFILNQIITAQNKSKIKANENTTFFTKKNPEVWNFKVFKKMLKVAFKKDDSNIVFLIARPYSLTYMAIIKKIFYRQKMVAYLLDPDSTIQLFNKKKKNYFFSDRLPMKLIFWFSEIIYFHSEAEKKFILKKYQQKDSAKYKILPFITDTDEINLQNQTIDQNKIIIRYMGSFMKERDGQEFLQVLNDYMNEYPHQNIVFEAYGKGQIDQNLKLNKKFIFHNQISNTQALEKMATATILVSIDANFPNSEYYPYFPSKLINYTKTDRPIIVISSNNSPAYQISQDFKLWHSDFNLENIKKTLNDIIKNYKYYVPAQNEKYTNNKIIETIAQDLENL